MLFRSIAVVCIVFSTQANSLNKLDGTLDLNTSKVTYADDISILSIKADVDANKRAYFMTGSVTTLKAPKTGDVATSLDISFRNSLVISRRGSNYIQANAQAKRNDNNRTNEIRIYVHHDSRGQGKVDKNNVKINWKSGASGEIDGKLLNVTVIYQKDSILITGSFQKNGYTLGVCLAIAKETRLI